MKKPLICLAAVALLLAGCGSATEEQGASSNEPAMDTPPAAEQSQPSPAMTETATIGGATISIDYSSPRVRGREGQIFGPDGLIGQDPNYPIWRAGANSATTIHTSADIRIGDVEVPAGDHTLYVNLADPDNWELVINNQTGQWGLEYNESQDLGRTAMTMSAPASIVEELKYTLTPGSGKEGTLTLAWEDHSASVPITVE